MSDAGPLLITLALLLANAFFVASEFALVAARRTQLEPQAEAGSRRARVTMRAMRRVSLVMAGAQLGITLSTVVLGAVGEPAVSHLLEPAFHAAGLPEAMLHPVSLVLATLIVAGLHVVVGEMVPKNLTLAAPERSALLLGPPIAGFVRVLKPVIVALNSTANASLRVLGVQPQDEVSNTASGAEVAEMVDESRREGLMDREEYSRVARSLEFSSATARDVLIEPAALHVLAADTTPGEVEAAAARTGHSRFPVGEPAGPWRHYVHLKDMVSLEPDRADLPLSADLLRPLPTVPADIGLIEVLDEMRDGSTHVAAVADDGEVAGLVMLDDVLLALLPPRRRGPSCSQRPE